MANLNKLAEASIKGLEKSMLGGVKKESAVKAIKEVAEEGSRQIEQLTQTASSQSARITGLSQEVNEATQQLKNANASLAYTQGELAIKNKTLVETTEQLTKTKTDLVEAKSTKKGVSKLEDGSIQEISVNKNGTRMRKIKDANGNVKSYEVEQLDGSLRKTEFDSLSGKRIQTKTNTLGEDVTMDYDLAGKNAKIRTNAEPKPTLLKREKVDGKIVEEFSDGSKTIRTQINAKGSRIEKFDKSGNITEKYEEILEKDYKKTYHVAYGKNESVVTSTYGDDAGYAQVSERTISTNEFGEKFISRAKFTSNDGEIVYKPTQTDVMGNVIKGESVTTYKLPEDANGLRVKSVKTSFDIDNSNGFYGPQAIRTADTVITKDGSRLERMYQRGRSSQVLAYDSKGTGNSYIKDEICFSDKYFGEPLNTNFLILTTNLNGIL